MQPVLIATDFSDSSANATQFGLQLAQGLNTAVVLVHVVEPIGDADGEDAEIRQFHGELLDKGREKLRAELSGWTGAVQATSQIELGPRVPTLLRMILELRPHLVVMGSRLLETRHMGIGLELLVRCPQPVLLVPFETVIPA